MDRYTDTMAQAYAGIFTEDDLNAILAFDGTSIGQKLVVATPELIQASALAGRRLGKEVIAHMDAKKKETNQPGKL